ncbi:MAG: cation diffusion facilitator family transporter [Coriobacteriia bacterium]|nr:cation diffusion facilitator family transporter [Coriobacteriia bacterium]
MSDNSIVLDTHDDTPEAHGESKAATIAAIAANIAIGVIKFIASAMTGSAAMFSEGIHSIVDSGNGLLVLLGMHQAKKPADVTHPFGYGRELYFWILVVAVSIFAVGGGVSVYEGIHNIRFPEQLGDPTAAYIVLALSILIEGASFGVAWKHFRAAKGKMRALDFIKRSKDPSLYTVVLEDGAAITGLLIALAGVFFGHLLGIPQLDGIASVLIGLLLMAVAFVLLRETKALLIGEGLETDELLDMRALIAADPSVEDVGVVRSQFFGPQDLLINADVQFDPTLHSGEIDTSIERIEKSLKAKFPQISNAFIEVASSEDVAAYRSTSLLQKEYPGA